MENEIKTRREQHIKKLIEVKNMMQESETFWEMKDIYEAIIAGGMALQRLNKIDFPEEQEKE